MNVDFCERMETVCQQKENREVRLPVFAVYTYMRTDVYACVMRVGELMLMLLMTFKAYGKLGQGNDHDHNPYNRIYLKRMDNKEEGGWNNIGYVYIAVRYRCWLLSFAKTSLHTTSIAIENMSVCVSMIQYGMWYCVRSVELLSLNE